MISGLGRSPGERNGYPLQYSCPMGRESGGLQLQKIRTLQPHGLKPTRLLCPWNSPGRITEVGSHSFLQGIFLTQGPNPGILNFRQILYHLSHQRRSLPACFGLILFISNNKKSGSQDQSNIPVASPEVTQVLCIFLFYHP